ncbi:hypothetical protein II906_00575 [bacterium]|nr:hypothetical protein [bacterium]
MSDDRLFASNNAIGRKWYYINMIIIAALAYGVYYFFGEYVYPNVKNASYTAIGTVIENFIYVIFVITFLALIDRRLYDIAGSRSKEPYKTLSGLLGFVIAFQVLTIILNYIELPVELPLEMMQSLAYILDYIALFIIAIIGLIKGKISSKAYYEYSSNDKYDI